MNPQENQGGAGPMRGGEAQAQQGAGADTASHGGHGGMHAGYCHGHGYGLAMAGPPWAAGYMAPWHGPHSHPYAYPYGPGFAPGGVPPVWAPPAWPPAGPAQAAAPGTPTLGILNNRFVMGMLVGGAFVRRQHS